MFENEIQLTSRFRAFLFCLHGLFFLGLFYFWGYEYDEEYSWIFLVISILLAGKGAMDGMGSKGKLATLSILLGFLVILIDIGFICFHSVYWFIGQ